VGNPGGKRPFGRLKCRYEGNNKLDLQEMNMVLELD